MPFASGQRGGEVNWTPSLGWNRPTPAHYARCKAGPPAADILAGVVPAPKVDLSNLVTIINQLDLGSCTANSTAQIVHAAMVSAGLDPATPFFSRLLAYYLARLEDGNQATDAGSQNCTVIDAACRMGFCKESVWPYDIGKFAVKPSADAVWAAYDQRGKVDLNYHRIDTVSGSELLTTMKQALTAGYLFNFGTPVTEDFCSDNIGGSPDHAAFPPVDGKGIAGGHSMTACGYDDTLTRPVFKIANSWGKEFGDGGFCYFDESYMTWYETSDMWIVLASPRFSGGVA
jgi:C1A family cysteine protease